jgi:hypothetical protein
MIKLDENYTIKADPYCWVLEATFVKMGTDKEGNPKEITSTEKWYPATFKQALLTYIDEILKEVPEINVILAKLNELEEKFDKLNLQRNDHLE